MVSCNIFWKGHVVKEKMFFLSTHHPSPIMCWWLLLHSGLCQLISPPPLYIVDNCDHFAIYYYYYFVDFFPKRVEFATEYSLYIYIYENCENLLKFFLFMKKIFKKETNVLVQPVPS